MHYKRNQRYGSPTGKTPVDTKPIPKTSNDGRSKAFLIDRNSIYTASEIGKLFKMSNRSVSEGLGNVASVGEANGRLAYSLPEVAQAIWGLTLEDADADDPYAGLKPSDRKMLIESQIKFVDLQDIRGKYTHTDESHQYLADKFKKLDMQLAILPDQVEREAGLTPEQLSIIDRCVDTMRREILG